MRSMPSEEPLLSEIAANKVKQRYRIDFGPKGQEAGQARAARIALDHPANCRAARPAPRIPGVEKPYILVPLKRGRLGKFLMPVNRLSEQAQTEHYQAQLDLEDRAS